MKTYREHYLKCKKIFGSKPDLDIRDISLKLNCFEKSIPEKLIKLIDDKVAENMSKGKNIIDTNWSRHLSGWDDIPEIGELCKLVMPQIEKDFFGCNIKVEHLHIYENKKNITLESSWEWHYDDAPQEYLKFAIYLNDVSEQNGCMQVVGDMDDFPVIDTYRTNPHSIKGYPPPVFPKTRVPKTYVDKLIKHGLKINSLTGKRGTHFLFTPNIIHRGTEPTQTSEPRRAIFFFIRPCLEKQSDYLADARALDDRAFTKKYKLD